MAAKSSDTVLSTTNNVGDARPPPPITHSLASHRWLGTHTGSRTEVPTMSQTQPSESITESLLMEVETDCNSIARG